MGDVKKLFSTSLALNILCIIIQCLFWGGLHCFKIKYKNMDVNNNNNLVCFTFYVDDANHQKILHTKCDNDMNSLLFYKKNAYEPI